nr:hypothetical protein [Halomonas sp.]
MGAGAYLLSLLVIAACGIGLYALHHGLAIMQATNDGLAQQAVFTEFSVRIRWLLIAIVLVTVSVSLTPPLASRPTLATIPAKTAGAQAWDAF